MQRSILKAIPSFILILLFFACSNHQTTQEAGVDYTNTLRNQFKNRFSDIQWTEELNPQFISDRKSLDSAHFSSRSLSSVNAASVLSYPATDAIYPAVPDFGSIDIRELPSSLKSVITDFCSKLLNISQTEDFQEGQNTQKEGFQETYSALAPSFLSGRQYMLSIYLHDTASYPAANKFYLGSPSIKDKTYEVPVLFLSQKGSWIVVFYALLQEDSWKIEQIRYGDFVYE